MDLRGVLGVPSASLRAGLGARPACGSEKDRKENDRKEDEPAREETVLGSPHIPFCHLPFYPSSSRPKVAQVLNEEST